MEATQGSVSKQQGGSNQERWRFVRGSTPEALRRSTRQDYAV